MRENWRRVTREQPEIFAAFAACEDPFDLALDRFAALAGLAGRRTLELACGSGRATRRWHPLASRYWALDRSRPLLALARRALGRPAELAWLGGDARRLPLADASCERVVARHFLAYLRPASQAAIVAEAERALAPGGEIWLLETHWQGEWMELRGRAGPWAESEVRPLVEEHGFKLCDEIDSSVVFPGLAAARQLVGALVGEQGLAELARRPRLEIAQRLVALRRRRSETATRARWRERRGPW